QLCKDFPLICCKETTLEFLKPADRQKHILRRIPCNKKIVVIMTVGSCHCPMFHTVPGHKAIADISVFSMTFYRNSQQTAAALPVKFPVFYRHRYQLLPGLGPVS